ncbi:MAG: hypothetical protein QOI50_7165, partial [Pseudonocardiales bacterium]|nr:hypothetical protein [Pseudonocardiales bacterium]
MAQWPRRPQRRAHRGNPPPTAAGPAPPRRND